MGRHTGIKSPATLSGTLRYLILHDLDTSQLVSIPYDAGDDMRHFEMLNSYTMS